jgi:hypothetical protein
MASEAWKMTWIDKLAENKMSAWYNQDLNKHEKLLHLLETYHKITIEKLSDPSRFGDMLSWCLVHCKGKFRDLKHGDGLVWYFELEEDATMFALRWL